MIDEMREHEEFLRRELAEQNEICRGCPHEDDLGKEACMDCGTNTRIRDIEEELSEIEEGLEEL